MEPHRLENGPLSFLDYSVLLFSLALSVGIGIYHAIKNYLLIRSKQLECTQKDEYMLGGRRLPPLPVALSLLTTFLSGVLMLGVPAEIFQRGTHIWFNFVIGALSMAISAWIFLPLFHKMKATCIHEYFIHRYHSVLLRQAFSIMFLALNLTYIAVVIYAPCVAMSPVLGINKYILIVALGSATTLYTVIGGLRAVVWTDSLQALLMYSGVFAIIYKGLLNPKVGGIKGVWNIAKDSGRIEDLWHFNLTPAQYNSFWINLISGTVTWLATFGVNQLAVQRYCSLPTIQDTKRIIYWTIGPFICLCSLASSIGFIALAYFYNCNPLEVGSIKNADHLTILFAKEVLTPTPGLFGLYVACIMSATLSTLSSGMNSMAAATYEDFVQSCFAADISDRQSTRINKGFVLIFGLLSTSLAFAAEPLGGILRVCISVFGALSGPFVGIFVLAIFWPKSGFNSTFISFILSSIIMVIVCFCNYFEDPYRELVLPTNSTRESCNNVNFTTTSPPLYDAHFGDPNTSYIARISTYAYSGIGMIVMLILGVSLSYLFHESPLPGIEPLTFAGRHLPLTPVLYNERSQTALKVLPKDSDRVDEYLF